MRYFKLFFLFIIGSVFFITGCVSNNTGNTSFAGGSMSPQNKYIIELEQPDRKEHDNVEEVSRTPDEIRAEYELVWSDEFEYEGKPDQKKWSYDTGGHGWGNNELQYYTKGDNAEVRDGILIIEVRKEERGGKQYTSTRLISKHKGDWCTFARKMAKFALKLISK